MKLRLRSSSGGIVRVLLYLLAGLVGLVLLSVVAVYAVSQSRLTHRFPADVRSVAVASSPELVAKGRHIAVTRACADCHGADFAGKAVIDDPVVGHLHGPNITRGQGGVAADYADVDYVRAIRHGLARDGRPLVLMPSLEYTDLSDEDLGALIAYIQSLPKVDKARGPVELGPLGRFLVTLGEIKLAAAHIDHSAQRPAKVEPTASADYGRYLSASCTGCHGNNLSGGKIPGAPPDWPATANLTPHASARVATWTEADFFQALRTQKRPDGSAIHPVMPAAFGQLTDLETRALWLYLRSLPPSETGAR